MVLGTNIIGKLSIKERERVQKVMKILGQQLVPIGDDERVKEIRNVLLSISTNEADVFKLIDAFNYGMIMGIRAERARRKGGANRG